MFVTLGDGAVFGEVSILNIPGNKVPFIYYVGTFFEFWTPSPPPPEGTLNEYVDKKSWIGGHSITTLFCTFLTTMYTYVDIFNPKCGQK